MGLDMYLTRSIRGYRKADGTISHNMKDYKTDKFGRGNAVTESVEVAYWRKANMIHRWFMNNVCHGEEDCREYDVSLENIKELLGICKNILKIVKGAKMVVPKNLKDAYLKQHPNGELTTTLQDTSYKFFNKSSTSKDFKTLDIWWFELDKPSKDKVADLLPTVGGFFFGSTKYDGVYLYQIALTVEVLTQLIKEDDKLRKKGIVPDYEYCASW